MWGIHVRHGDAKSMSDVYGNRRWFPFSDYFDAAAALAAQTASPPTAIYVTSDSLETQEEVTLGERGGWPDDAHPHVALGERGRGPWCCPTPMLPISLPCYHYIAHNDGVFN